VTASTFRVASGAAISLKSSRLKNHIQSVDNTIVTLLSVIGNLVNLLIEAGKKVASACR